MNKSESEAREEPNITEAIAREVFKFLEFRRERSETAAEWLNDYQIQACTYSHVKHLIVPEGITEYPEGELRHRFKKEAELCHRFKKVLS